MITVPALLTLASSAVRQGAAPNPKRSLQRRLDYIASNDAYFAGDDIRWIVAKDCTSRSRTLLGAYFAEISNKTQLLAFIFALGS